MPRSCLITSNMLSIGPQWLVIFMMLHISVSGPLHAVIFNLRTRTHRLSSGGISIMSWLDTEYHCHSSKVSWLIAPKPTGMRFELFTVAMIPRFLCLVVNERAIFTGANPLRSTLSNSLSMTSKTNTGTCACNIATQYLWMKLRLGILQLEHGGLHQKLPQRLD